MTVLAHTGALYALIDRSDAWHPLIRSWWLLARERVVVPAVVVPVIARVVALRLGAAAASALAASLAEGEFVVAPCEGADLVRAAELVAEYPEPPLRFVDAAIVAMAERLDAQAILATERASFERIRPTHVERLRLLP